MRKRDKHVMCVTATFAARSSAAVACHSVHGPPARAGAETTTAAAVGASAATDGRCRSNKQTSDSPVLCACRRNLPRSELCSDLGGFHFEEEGSRIVRIKVVVAGLCAWSLVFIGALYIVLYWILYSWVLYNRARQRGQ